MAKELTESKAVKKTMVEEVAVQIAGWTPMVNIKGTVIIPPPIPNIPAHTPERMKKNG